MAQINVHMTEVFDVPRRGLFLVVVTGDRVLSREGVPTTAGSRRGEPQRKPFVRGDPVTEM